MCRAPNVEACVLCGSKNKLIGEQKIKAPALRHDFGNFRLTIGSHEDGSRLWFAQSAKYRSLHFRSRLYQECNSTRTQASAKHSRLLIFGCVLC